MCKNLFSVSDQSIFCTVDNSLQTWCPVFKTAMQLNLKHLYKAENNFCFINADTLQKHSAKCRNFLNKKRRYRRNCSMQEHPSRTEVWWCEIEKCSPYCTFQSWAPQGTNTSVCLSHSSPLGDPSQLPISDARCYRMLLSRPTTNLPSLSQGGSMAPDSLEWRANPRKKVVMAHCILLPLLLCHRCLTLHKRV